MIHLPISLWILSAYISSVADFTCWIKSLIFFSKDKISFGDINPHRADKSAPSSPMGRYYIASLKRDWGVSLHYGELADHGVFRGKTEGVKDPQPPQYCGSFPPSLLKPGTVKRRTTCFILALIMRTLQNITKQTLLSAIWTLIILCYVYWFLGLNLIMLCR